MCDRKVGVLLLVGVVLAVAACNKPEHNANWYYYWEKDGVVPDLDRSAALYFSRWGWDEEAATKYYGGTDGRSGGYGLTDLCITSPALVPRLVRRLGQPPDIEIGATTTWAVETAGAVARHEKQHIIHWREIHIAGLPDTDGDGLADAHEGPGMPYDFIIGEKDTYWLGVYISLGYATYGDDEFIARTKEQAGANSVALGQDWSVGGARWRH